MMDSKNFNGNAFGAQNIMSRAMLGQTMQGLRTYLAEHSMSIPSASRMAIRLLTSYEDNEYKQMLEICKKYTEDGLECLPTTDVPVKMFLEWVELRRMVLRAVLDRLQMVS
jgi:hypothetical protein